MSVIHATVEDKDLVVEQLDAVLNREMLHVGGVHGHVHLGSGSFPLRLALKREVRQTIIYRGAIGYPETFPQMFD